MVQLLGGGEVVMTSSILCSLEPAKWENICRQNRDQIHIINFYFMAFDCGPPVLFMVLWVVSLQVTLYHIYIFSAI